MGHFQKSVGQLHFAMGHWYLEKLKNTWLMWHFYDKTKLLSWESRSGCKLCVACVITCKMDTISLILYDIINDSLNTNTMN